MVLENLEQAAEELEKQELQAQGGVASPDVFAKLLAIYLLQNDLCNAKLLWKRIPQSVKAQNLEIGKIWTVGKAMWLRDSPGVFSALSSTQWSDEIAPIMAALVDKVRERCLGLVSQAYTSVTLETLSKLLGVNPSEAAAVAQKNGWNVEDKLVYPVKPVPQPKILTSTEQQLHILTNFVSFLEN
ncbi:cop9 signalosome complex subunit [Nesidiocoris tenuis]|uniref:COP9 signalosome complex subunit 8 n=1 Tax=Nesidiocoris tenuis TaxID=355587 RepID=A0ABN7AD87_9HEMI|nr:cop9 signalosome complex subunit [Nesidiocoris tenuis]